MKVEVIVKPGKAQEILGDINRKIQNLTPAMRDISVYLKSIVYSSFKKQGRSAKWPDLAPSTKKYKEREKGQAYPMLEFSGKLKQSINTKYSSNFARIFTGVRYGTYHQVGTKKMPARPFMEFLDQDKQRIVSIIQKSIMH